MKIGFTVDLHDSDGDVTSECIVLHLSDVTMLKIKDIKELDQIIKNLKDIKKELIDNYNL